MRQGAETLILESLRYPRSFVGFLELKSYILLILLGLANEHVKLLPSLKLTFFAPKNGMVGILRSYWGPAHFQGLWLLVSGRAKCYWSDREVFGCFEISFC